MTSMTTFDTKSMFRASTFNYHFDEINQLWIFFHNISFQASWLSFQPTTSENPYIIYFFYFILGISYIVEPWVVDPAAFH